MIMLRLFPVSAIGHQMALERARVSFQHHILSPTDRPTDRAAPPAAAILLRPAATTDSAAATASREDRRRNERARSRAPARPPPSTGMTVTAVATFDTRDLRDSVRRRTVTLD